MDYNHISHIWLITGQQIQLGGHLQMKRKLIIALAAAMTITLGSVGVVSADDTNFAPFIPVKETPIRDGFVWIVDTPAWTEEIKHPAETKQEWKVDKPAEYEQVWVVDKEAWDEVVHHEAEYKTVHHEAEYKHHEAVYETVHHPEEGHYDLFEVCGNCGFATKNPEEIYDHIKNNAENGCLQYGNKEIWVVDKPAWDEQVLVKEAWDELIKEAWDEQVLVKEAWDETVHHEEEGHYENGKLISPEEGHYETVVVKPAWTEKVEHPEVGHWEPIPENPDEQEPETPQNPDEQEPETPQNPDEQEPETPQNPDEQEPETPQNPDEQNPETPDNNQNNNENNNQNENNSQNNNENTSQNNNSSETNNSQDDSTGKQPPKTGDPTSFASLYALAGSALAGIGAVKLKFRKRK